jgi:trehalose 6-phosphate synthase/phosphatase
LLLLDYDGTLVPLASRPHDAAPEDDLLALLNELTGDHANSVIVVSGRRAAELERWLGQIPRLGLAPEHGARWHLPGSDIWQGRTAETEWKPEIRSILEHFADRTPGSFIEEKEFALVWHYRLAEAEFGDWLATELVAMLEGMLAETELRAYRGKKNIEVKPMWANKGSFFNELLPLFSDASFIMGIGDDRTDEDLFSRMPNSAWSIHVGSGPSKARYSIADTVDVRKLLRLLSTAQTANT